VYNLKGENIQINPRYEGTSKNSINELTILQNEQKIFKATIMKADRMRKYL
jgi:hypothetical protein